MLLNDAGALIVRSLGRDIAITQPLTVELRIQQLLALGYSLMLAQSIAHGGLSRREAAIDLAHVLKLLRSRATAEQE